MKKSIKAQMTLLVLSSAALILGLVETYSYVNTRQMILKTGQSIATHLTRSMTRRIEQEFRAVEKLPQSLSVFMSISPVRDTSKFKSLMVNLVHENPELFASGLFFEPTGEGRMTPGVTPYAFRKKDGIEYAQLAGSGYAYLEKQFYILPKVLNCPVWSDPYFDKGGGNIPMATYSVPLYRPGLRDKAQGFYGVATADISLKWLTEFTRSVRSGKTGFSFIITRTGLFVVHPDESLIHGESIFSLADKHNSSKLRAIAIKMIREEQGFLPIGPVLAGEDAYLAWDEISCSGWILGTVVAKKELFRELDLLKQRSIGICIAGLVLLLGASLGVARSLSRPLVDMAATTRRDCQGDA
ncbi:MAG: hypothetical protein HUK40_07605 [Desulfobacter sp.]|nr:hypothetical protein [Desulfobacter sp.]